MSDPNAEANYLNKHSDDAQDELLRLAANFKDKKELQDITESACGHIDVIDEAVKTINMINGTDEAYDRQRAEKIGRGEA